MSEGGSAASFEYVIVIVWDGRVESVVALFFES